MKYELSIINKRKISSLKIFINYITGYRCDKANQLLFTLKLSFCINNNQDDKYFKQKDIKYQMPFIQERKSL